MKGRLAELEGRLGEVKGELAEIEPGKMVESKVASGVDEYKAAILLLGTDEEIVDGLETG